MKPSLKIISTILLLLAAVIVGAAERPIDRIVAVVNDGVVLESELTQEYARVMAELRRRPGELPPEAVIRKQVLERLISKKLQLEAAERSGIQVTEAVVAEAVANVAKENKMSLAEMRKVLEEDGVSFTSFRDDLRDRMTIQRLRDQEVMRRIRVTDREVEGYLQREKRALAGRNSYHLQHILIATPSGASAEQIDVARNKAERLVRELRSGGDFRSLALANSDGQQALEGGDLGWRTSDQLPSQLTDIVSQMERGQISDPMSGTSGYHIVKLVDYKGGNVGRKLVTQTHARHILIKTNEVTSDSDARTRLGQLKQRIESGTEFEGLARSHSEDSGSAIRGGDLGWVNPGDVVPEFEEEMNNLAPGRVSEPFRTEFGWHILQVLERRNFDSTEQAERNEARSAIRQKKAEEEYELFLRRLRDEAYVDIRLGEVY